MKYDTSKNIEQSIKNLDMVHYKTIGSNHFSESQKEVLEHLIELQIINLHILLEIRNNNETTK